MKPMRHTINIALGLNVVVFDNQGRRVDEFIFPFALLFFSLPALLYGWLRAAVIGLVETVLMFFDLAGWQHDLTLIVWSIRLLIRQRRFAYA